MMRENPLHHLSYLQQTLSSDKKPIGLFLGAGCPMAVRVDGGPIIPDVINLTEAIRARLKDDAECGPLLVELERNFTEDNRSDPTVEDMLTHIRALRSVAGHAQVRGFSAVNLDLLDTRICECIHELVDTPLPTGSETPYHRLAGWIDAIQRNNPVEIFTTNYDLLVEQALEEKRVPYFDGFAGGWRPFFDLRAMEEDMLPLRWVRLWKLHGSINWYQAEGEGVYRGERDPGLKAKHVIHPSHLKYHESRRLPYLAMIDRLRAFLRLPTATLIVCGYSFRDEHLNEVIVQGLRTASTSSAFALAYGSIDGYSEAVALAQQRPNLSLLAFDGGVVGGRRVRWEPESAGSGENLGETGVFWEETSEPDSEIRWPKLALGDFEVFGRFLQELVGVHEVPSGGGA